MEIHVTVSFLLFRSFLPVFDQCLWYDFHPHTFSHLQLVVVLHLSLPFLCVSFFSYLSSFVSPSRFSRVSFCHRKSYQPSDIDSLSLGKMEPVNGNGTDRLRFLYAIGLLVDPILIVLCVMTIFSGFPYMDLDYIDNPRLIIHIIIVLISYGVGWIGYYTKCIFSIVIYSTALFVQDVYALVFIVQPEKIPLVIILPIRIYFSILVLRYAYALMAEKRRMSHVERNNEAHSMEPVNVNNDTGFLLRFLYVIGLSVDLVTSVYFGHIVWEFEPPAMFRGSIVVFPITIVVITVAIHAIGWVGYYTKCIHPVVIYGIAFFVESVYVSIVVWRITLFFIVSAIRVYFSILVLGYAYALIAMKWQMSHVERNDEAHSMEPVNVINEVTH